LESNPLPPGNDSMALFPKLEGASGAQDGLGFIKEAKP
jgi:hypothetical protein